MSDPISTAIATLYICTECTYPSRLADACDNPACFANPSLSEAHKDGVRAAAEAAARSRAEDEARLAGLPADVVAAARAAAEKDGRAGWRTRATSGRSCSRLTALRAGRSAGSMKTYSPSRSR